MTQAIFLCSVHAASESRVIGGATVVAGVYPSVTWTARLLALDKLGTGSLSLSLFSRLLSSVPGRTSICSATIIGPRHVLCTAHCLRSRTSPPTYVIFPQYVTVSVGLAPGPVVAVGKSIWIHPSYAPATAAVDVIDLAVLELNTTLPFGAAVSAIPLPVLGQSLVGASLVAAGWGYTNEGERAAFCRRPD